LKLTVFLELSSLWNYIHVFTALPSVSSKHLHIFTSGEVEVLLFTHIWYFYLCSFKSASTGLILILGLFSFLLCLVILKMYMWLVYVTTPIVINNKLNVPIILNGQVLHIISEKQWSLVNWSFDITVHTWEQVMTMSTCLEYNHDYSIDVCAFI